MISFMLLGSESNNQLQMFNSRLSIRGRHDFAHYFAVIILALNIPVRYVY